VSGEVRNIWTHGLRYSELRLLAAASALSLALVLALQLPWPRVLLHAGIAAVVWFFFEYFFHRFALHFPPDKLTWFTALHVHWKHHFEPNEPRLVFTPWWALLLMLAGTAAVGSQTEGLVSVGGALLGMSLTLYFYETTHLAAHVAYRPRTRWGQAMKRFHLLHHFQNEHYWFGVTHPVLDVLFGTAKPAKAVERSKTARTLGAEV
jgi:sterol desaturase/sphingolipid hydroxylase (fatty acid hydroxylase superfamily)